MHVPFHKDYDYLGLTKPIRRPLSAQEKEWANAILRENRDWADVTIGNLYVDGECTCGCRTVHLEHSQEPQNPRTRNLKKEHVGDLWIYTDDGKYIFVGLFARNGTLCELEVVYDGGTEPFPSAWREISRKLW